METVSVIQNSSIGKTRELTAEKTVSRTAYIDVVRLIMTIMVIAVHAAVTYGSIGDWTFVDPRQDETTGIILSFIVFYSQAFFMALFFFFSGYFTPGSVDRKGWGGFWKDRVLRIGIPMVAYTWFLSLLPNYLDEIGNNGYTGTFWQYAVNNFHAEADEGPTWFLFTVLLFCIAYFLGRIIINKAKLNVEWTKKLPAPSILTTISAAVLITIGMFITVQFLEIGGSIDLLGIFSLKITFFPSYIIFFIAGILAFRSNWMDGFSTRVIRFWNWMTLAMIIALPVFLVAGGAVSGKFSEYTFGMNWRSFLMCLWFSFSCVAFSISLTYWIKNQKKESSALAKIGSKDNYAVYIIHPLVLVPMAYLLSFTDLHPMVKFLVNMAVTVPVCFLLAEVLRRLPGLKKVL